LDRLFPLDVPPTESDSSSRRRVATVTASLVASMVTSSALSPGTGISSTNASPPAVS